MNDETKEDKQATWPVYAPEHMTHMTAARTVVVHYVTKAWKVGQLRRHAEHGPYFNTAGICTTWESVVEKANKLRATGCNGPIEALPFFAIVDGDNVHEVRTTAFNPTTGTPADAFRDVVTVLGEKEGAK